MLYHDQSNDITNNVYKLEESIEYIHTGPIIRRESVFENYTIDDRRKLLYKMLNFINHCDFYHSTIAINKGEIDNKVNLAGKIAKSISKEFNEHKTFFERFDRVIVYYDNGQTELSTILNAVFSIQFSYVEFRKAEPQKYRLLQAADFICAFELLRFKKNEKRLSKSEEKFFFKSNELKKTFLKSLDKKRLKK